MFWIQRKNFRTPFIRLIYGKVLLDNTPPICSLYMKRKIFLLAKTNTPPIRCFYINTNYSQIKKNTKGKKNNNLWMV